MRHTEKIIDLAAVREDIADDKLATAISKRFDGDALTEEEARILAAWDAQA